MRAVLAIVLAASFVLAAPAASQARKGGYYPEPAGARRSNCHCAALFSHPGRYPRGRYDRFEGASRSRW